MLRLRKGVGFGGLSLRAEAEEGSLFFLALSLSAEA